MSTGTRTGPARHGERPGRAGRHKDRARRIKDRARRLKQRVRRLMDRAGLPTLTGAGPFVAAHAVDSLGTGLVYAFTVVYLTHTTDLGLARIGAALTVGNLLALPAPALGGILMDRLGAKKVVALANVVCAAGFAAFLAVHSAWQISAAHLVVQTGINLYWTAARTLVPLASAPGEERLWFGFIASLRNTGIGAGAALSATVLALAGTGSLPVLIAVNTGTFLCAAALFARWRPVRTTARPDTGNTGASRGSWKAVLTDGRYLLLVATNLAFVLAQMVPPVLLAVYVTDTLHQGAWLSGTLLVVNTAAVALCTTAVTRRTARHGTHRVIATAFLVAAAAFALYAAPLALGTAPAWAVTAVLVAAMLLFTLSEILSSPPLNELSVALAPTEAGGRHQAAFQLSWSLGGAAAPVVLTALLARHAVLPWLLLAALSLLAVPAARALTPPEGETP